ncbi:formyltransferase family protein [Herbaspirillum sp.]|uniref:methionyl-tRNA formyltransferase n=1 Tax=Herbaspirillum sp. TaxID=1890675 RepID=UPI001B245D84|nr:formyltransferase family protein [Herbaspirillum sp.]MBO9536960.1 hypothetical protein [Herbaspirillum sp.]
MNNGKRMVMCGCHQGGENAIRDLIHRGYIFDYFVCLTPEQAAQANVSGYYDYRPLAQSLGIPVYIPETYGLTSEADLGFFAQQRFDLLIQGGWQRLFPEKVLATLGIGALGLHGSADKLPKGRGRSPLNWSLIEGKSRFLMHLFMIKPGADDGDVISIVDFDITEFDDIETLYFKYDLSYRKLLLDNLPSVLAGQHKTIPQLGQPSYYPKRTPADGEIHWETMDVATIYNFVRAQTRPYPGAFAIIQGKRTQIWKCRPFDTRLRYDDADYGAVVEQFGTRLLINCRGGLLLVDEWSHV